MKGRPSTSYVRHDTQEMVKAVVAGILQAEVLGHPADACRDHLWYTARSQHAAVNLSLLIDPDAALIVPSQEALLEALGAICSSEMIIELCYKPLLVHAGKAMKESDLVNILHRVLVFVKPLMPTAALQDAMALMYVAAMRGEHILEYRLA